MKRFGNFFFSVELVEMDLQVKKVREHGQNLL